MERRLKERLVGAAILVVLIVLVVPELLSGPKARDGHKQTANAGTGETPNEATRTVTVDLNTKRTLALDPAPEDAPVANTRPPTAPSIPAPQAAPEVPAQAAPQTAAPQTAAPSSSAPASTIENTAAPPKAWTLQLGSFSSRANADRLLQAVKAHNSPAYLSTAGSGKSLRYRVRVGPLTDHAAAERMLAKLKSEGHPGSVITP